MREPALHKRVTVWGARRAALLSDLAPKWMATKSKTTLDLADIGFVCGGEATSSPPRSINRNVAVRGTTKPTPSLDERWMAGTYARPRRQEGG